MSSKDCSNCPLFDSEKDTSVHWCVKLCSFSFINKQCLCIFPFSPIFFVFLLYVVIRRNENQLVLNLRVALENQCLIVVNVELYTEQKADDNETEYIWTRKPS